MHSKLRSPVLFALIIFWSHPRSFHGRHYLPDFRSPSPGWENMQRARKSAAWVLMRKSVLRLAFVLCALEVIEWESIWLGEKCELVEVIW